MQRPSPAGPALPRTACLSSLSVLALLFWVARPALTDEPRSGGNLLVRGGTVHVGDGSVLEGASVLIENGKITAVTADEKISAPEGVRTVDARGKHVVPGFVEPRSQLFLGRQEQFDLGRTEARNVLDGVDLFDSRVPLLRAQGITTVGIAGGSSRGAGGDGAVLKLRRSDVRRGIERSATLVRPFSHYVAALGVSPGGRSTSAQRLEQYQRLRDLFLRAQDYERSWENYWKAVEKYNKDLAEFRKREKEAKEKAESEKKKAGAAPGTNKSEAKPEGEKKDSPGRAPPAPGGLGAPEETEEKKDEGAAKAPAKPPPAPKPPSPPRRPNVDLASESLLTMVAERRPFVIEAHRRDDLEFALLLAEEFDLNLVVAGATRAFELTEKLKKAKCRVIVEPALLDGVALEVRGHREETAALLRRGGVDVALSGSLGGDGSALATRRLRLQAAVAVRGGLAPEEALRAITSAPAAMLGVADRVGSLVPGRDGDVVVLSGPPLEAASRVEVVAIDGFVVEERVVPTPAGDGWPEVATPAAAEALELESLRHAPTFALTGATVVSTSADRLTVVEGGILVVRDGKVAALGRAPDVHVPDGVPSVDLGGCWVLPGFIDAHSHTGLGGETDETAEAVTEDLRVVDGFDPWDDDLTLSLARGITTVALSPGGSNVVGGEVALVKLLPPGPRIRLFERHVALKASLTPSFALPRFPTSPSGAVVALARWIEAQDSQPEETPLLVETESLSALERLAGKLERLPAIVVVEGESIDRRAWNRFPIERTAVVLGPYELGEPAARLASAGELVKRGARVAFATDGTRRDLLTTAVLAIEYGLSRVDALRALTRTPAEIFGVEERIGAIEAGSDADIVVWSGDPFSLAARVEAVFVDGALQTLEHGTGMLE